MTPKLSAKSDETLSRSVDRLEYEGNREKPGFPSIPLTVAAIGGALFANYFLARRLPKRIVQFLQKRNSTESENNAAFVCLHSNNVVEAKKFLKEKLEVVRPDR